MKLRTQITILTVAILTSLPSAFGQDKEVKMVPQQQEQATDVSNQELQQFANVYKKVQTENQKVQQKVVKMIGNEGLDVKRYQELAQASKNPKKEVDASEEEQAKVNKINKKIQTIQMKFQKRVGTMIKDEGLTQQRYQEVYQAIQADADLQKKFGELVKG